MFKIIFKNMDSSELVKDIVSEKIQPIIEKYPALVGHQIVLTLEMENSPNQAGPDLFTVTSMVKGKTYKNLKIKRSSSNFYVAIGELADRFNEQLSKEINRLMQNNRKANREN
jgi:ribosomal subunit interface protein